MAIKMINKNSRITAKQLAAHLDASKRMILKGINKLKEKGEIVYIDSASFSYNYLMYLI